MDREERIAAILAAWTAAQQEGDLQDPEELIRNHPDLATELRAGFAALEYVDLAMGREPGTDPIPDRIDSYRVLDVLGVGGMGTVYLAQDESGGRVALKVIHPHLLQSPGYYRRFLREADLGMRVHHPNVVRTIDARKAPAQRSHFLVLEYVEGVTLRELADEFEQVPEQLCRHVGREIAKALAAVHAAGAIHRDLKPENVIITGDEQVKLMDLGVAQVPDETMRLSRTGAFVGSLLYAAPEQFTDTADPRGDLYSLGLVLYELAGGRHPFAADDLRTVLRLQESGKIRRISEINPQLSPFFEEVVDSLLQPDPERRFASARELGSVLEQGEESGWWEARARRIQQATAHPPRRIRIPRETASYGRDGELNRLDDAFRSAREGAGRVVLVEGEAGIGKTRLTDEFATRLQDAGEDFHLLYGGFAPGGAATAAGAFRSAFGEQLGEEGAGRFVGSPLLASALDSLLRGEPVERALSRDSIQTAFVAVARGLAAERPTVILIDDLHFAPEEGRTLFMALALALSGDRVLLVGTHRPDLPEAYRTSIDRLEHAERISLGRLSPKLLVALLKEAFQSEHLAHELGVRIAEKSDGNPFFVFEIIRDLRERGILARRPDGRWVSTSVIRDIEVPSSVIDLVRERVADLDPRELNLLEIAACCGVEFDPMLVARVLGLGPIPALQAFGRIEKRMRLVRSAGRCYRFDHHQIQEWLHAGLHDRLREEYHAALGAALLSENPAPRGAGAVALATHLLQGGRGEDARAHVGPALRHLDATYEHERGVDLAERALAVPGLFAGADRVGTLLGLAKRLDSLGRRDAERAALDEAVACAVGDPALTATTLRARGLHRVMVADFESAETDLNESREACRAAGDVAGEAETTAKLGILDLYRGRHLDASGHLDRALELAAGAGDRDTEETAVGNLGLTYWYLGRYEEAEKCYREHIALARAAGHRDSEAHGTGNLGILHDELGRFEEARRDHERHLELAREIGNRRSESQALGNLGLVHLALGHAAQAVEHTERQHELCKAIGDRRGCALARANLATIHSNLGNHDTARRRAQDSLDLSREIGERWIEAGVLSIQGDVELRAGNPGSAGEVLERSLALNRELENPRGAAGALALLSAIGQGTERLDEAIEIGRELSVPRIFVPAAAHRCLLTGEGAPEALRLYEEYRNRLGHRERLETSFALWKATGDAALLEEAKELLDHLREHAPAGSPLERVPTHAEITGA